jgi:alanine dehydrogenase
MLLIDHATVEELLDFPQLVETLAPAMAELSRGEVSMPPRTGPRIAEVNGVLGVMSAYLSRSRILACKLVSIYPENAANNLPTHSALVVVYDPQTGIPVALLDGGSITATRTAAGSALATKLLARAESRILTIVGTGVQARSHALGIPQVIPIDEIRIVGRNWNKAKALAAEVQSRSSCNATPFDSIQDALWNADIVCTTTHPSEPVLNWSWLSRGTHINSIGLERELDEETVVNSSVFVESRESVLADPPAGSNDLLLPIKAGAIDSTHIQAEIGELVTGKHSGRTSPEEITLYKSVGVAVQDAVAAQLVLEIAQQSGRGVEITI